MFSLEALGPWMFRRKPHQFPPFPFLSQRNPHYDKLCIWTSAMCTWTDIIIFQGRMKDTGFSLLVMPDDTGSFHKPVFAIYVTQGHNQQRMSWEPRRPLQPTDSHRPSQRDTMEQHVLSPGPAGWGSQAHLLATQSRPTPPTPLSLSFFICKMRIILQYFSLRCAMKINSDNVGKMLGTRCLTSISYY